MLFLWLTYRLVVVRDREHNFPSTGVVSLKFTMSSHDKVVIFKTRRDGCRFLLFYVIYLYFLPQSKLTDHNGCLISSNCPLNQRTCEDLECRSEQIEYDFFNLHNSRARRERVPSDEYMGRKHPERKHQRPFKPQTKLTDSDGDD